MAHHGEILYQHLYDGLHLNQSGVRLFIKDIKDTALDRNRSAPHITNKSASNHQSLHRRLQHTRDTTNNGRSFSQRLGPASRYYAPATPLQGPSPITPLYTSAPPPQDHNPTTPHYTSPLQGPELQFVRYPQALQVQYSWQQQQQPAQTRVQSPAQRDSYAAVAAKLDTSTTELSLKWV